MNLSSKEEMIKYRSRLWELYFQNLKNPPIKGTIYLLIKRIDARIKETR